MTTTRPPESAVTGISDAEAMAHLKASFATRGLLLEDDPFPLWMQFVASVDQITRERDALKTETAWLENALGETWFDQLKSTLSDPARMLRLLAILDGRADPELSTLRSERDRAVEAHAEASEAAAALLKYLDDHDWGLVPEGVTADRLRAAIQPKENGHG